MDEIKILNCSSDVIVKALKAVEHKAIHERGMFCRESIEKKLGVDSVMLEKMIAIYRDEVPELSFLFKPSKVNTLFGGA